MKKISQKLFYKQKFNYFVEFFKPKLYADVNLSNSKDYSDVENFKLKFGYIIIT